MSGQILDSTVIQARPARLTAEEKAVVRGGGTPADWSPARRSVEIARYPSSNT
jgi:hypothetical protein